MSKAARLRSAVLELWQEHKAAGMLPTSARFLFYELVAREIIPKHSTGARRADQDAGDALTWLREKGRIPWDDIVDETRSLDDYSGYPSIWDAAINVLEQLHIDPWKGSWPIILTESRSLAGVLRSLAEAYGVQIASLNGQCGGFLHTDVAPRLTEGQRVLYFGDLDFSGGHIEMNAKRVLEQLAGELKWERLALTQEQATRHGLTPISKYDGRDKKHHDAIETEALNQAVIVEILRSRLDELIPQSLKTVQARSANGSCCEIYS
jgi:hypothetical protein